MSADSDELDAVIVALEERDDAEEHDDTYLSDSLHAFRSMRERGVILMSHKQKAWVRNVAERLELDAPVPRGPVPRGAEMPMLFKKGPLKPPGRR